MPGSAPPMRRSTDRILTTHGGRLPNPGIIAALQCNDGDQQRRSDLVSRGIAELVERQRAHGVDVISDGEFFHDGGPYDFDFYATRFDGIDKQRRNPGEIGWIGESTPESQDPRFAGFYRDYVPYVGRMPDYAPPSAQMPTDLEHRFVVTGPIRYTGAARVERELDLAKSGLVAAGADPADVFYPQMGVAWHSHFLWNEHYASTEEFAFALAEGLRPIYRTIVDAGFLLQLDDPSVASRYAMLNPPMEIDDYRRYARVWIEAQNHAIAGLPQDRIRYHVCWGSFHFPHTRDIPLENILDLILSINAGAYSIEASNTNHQLDHRVWETARLPDGKILIPGVVGHATSNAVEPPELVAHRILTYARLVGRENVIAGTDCGLGLRCHDDVVWAKLASLARGAQLASNQLWG